MTIQYVHPSVTELTRVTPDLLRFYSRPRGAAVDTFMSPSDRITTHYSRILAAAIGKLNQTHFGVLFEACVYDALLAYGVRADAVTLRQDYSRGKHAEIDFLVTAPSGHKVAILVKTSLRERWKQLDRDALVMERLQKDQAIPRAERKLLDIYGVFFRENATQTVDQAMRKANSLEGMFESSARLITAFDSAAVDDLFRACGAAI